MYIFVSIIIISFSKYRTQSCTELGHRAFGVALDDECLEAGVRTHQLLDFFEWDAFAEIHWGEMFPKLHGYRIGHVEGFLGKLFAVEAAAEVTAPVEE